MRLIVHKTHGSGLRLICDGIGRRLTIIPFLIAVAVSGCFVAAVAAPSPTGPALQQRSPATRLFRSVAKFATLSPAAPCRQAGNAGNAAMPKSLYVRVCVCGCV